MAKKEFTYRGKTVEELKTLTIEQFTELLPSAQRRKLKRGLKENEKKLLKTAKKHTGHKPIRTHSRDMVIIPELIGKKLAIYNGKHWEIIEIAPEMIGHILGEFSLTRKRVSHSGPGIGATRGLDKLTGDLLDELFEFYAEKLSPKRTVELLKAESQLRWQLIALRAMI